MNTNSLAKRLKELRALRGISQEFLAEESRVSLRTIQRIENEESVPTGETIKRISSALDVATNELVDSKSIDETSNLKGTIIFFKRQLSKSIEKYEIRTFKRFITILTNLKNKDLTQEQLDAIESYLKYLELEKIPSYSNDLYKQKLTRFRKYLKTKLRFVPNNYYTSLAIMFTIPFAIGFAVSSNKIDITTKIAVTGAAIFIVATCVIIDFRIKKNGRSLGF